MMVYGTEEEENEKELIRSNFDDFGIVSPKFYEGSNKKMNDDMDRLYEGNNGKTVKEMEFYKMIVSSCQMLVYSKWEGQIPSGVAIEVNHTLDIGIPVFKLEGDEFIKQKAYSTVSVMKKHPICMRIISVICSNKSYCIPYHFIHS